MKIAFYVSEKAGRLCKFMEQASEDEKKQIALVISEDKLPQTVIEMLIHNNIEYHIFEYKKLPGIYNKEKNIELSNKMLMEFEKKQIDYCFCFGRHILMGDLLKKYHNKMINFHPSILPMFPGNRAIDQAVAFNSVFLLGNTAHFIDEQVDGGPIIMQSVVPIQAFYDSGNDYNIILDVQIEMIKKIMKLLKEKRLIIEEHTVKIVNANYNRGFIFPDVE